MVPPPLFVVPPAILDNYRLRMRQHCAIPNVLDRTRCLVCRDPRTASAPGEREHVKTGVCEACWDLLVADTEERRRTAVARCTRLAGPDDLVRFIRKKKAGGARRRGRAKTQTIGTCLS